LSPAQKPIRMEGTDEDDLDTESAEEFNDPFEDQDLDDLCNDG
jgi:hypothetical protein